MKKINVLIAEDHRIVREGLISCLMDKPEIKIIGQAKNGKEAVSMAETLQPDVILMDITMPELNGLDATKTILGKYNKIKILALTAHDEDEYIIELIRAGASGYILKDSSSSELFEAIKTIYNGEHYFSEHAKKAIMKDYINNLYIFQKDDEVLSERETQVLIYIAEGYPNKEIAKKLDLSTKTICSHRESMMKKLKIHSIAGLTKYAIQKGLIKMPVK